MKRVLKSVSKISLLTGLVLLLSCNMINAAPLVYDMDEPEIRTEYNDYEKIKLEGAVNFSKDDQTVTLSLRNTDVQQVLRMFADKAGLNIVFHESAKGNVTLDLVDVKLSEAFKMVMKITNLTYVIKDKTMIVVATSEAENVNITKDNIAVLPVKYADAGYLANFLNNNVFSLNSPGLSFGPIVTTNSERNELLIFGTDNDYQMARKIVEKFDKKPEMTTFKVNHTTPYEMAKMVCETLFNAPMQGGSSKAGEHKTQYELKGKESTSKSDDEIVLGAGSIACTLSSTVSTNNISSYQSKPSMTLYVQPELGTLTMVGGSDKQVEMVNDFIVLNDKKQPQAILELSIIALTEDGSKEFSNSWTYAAKSPISFSGDTGFSSGKIYWRGHSGSEASHDLTQTLTYLIENAKGRMVGNPKIVLTNGKKSVIDLTADYVESVTVQTLAGAGGTTSGSVQKTYNIEEDLGTKVEIVPFISPDGYVSLNLKPEYTNVAREITGYYNIQDENGNPKVITYPEATLLQRHNLELKNVRIKDGETLLLGGMITETETSNVSKIPILGDIPGIGFFFRSQTKSMKKEELMMVLTPRIIYDTEDVADL